MSIKKSKKNEKKNFDAGCCFLVTTIEACFIGFLGATLTFMSMMMMERIYWFDDPCAAFPVHGLSGIWVTI
jgi:ammonia channel protein AmtB